MSRPETHSGFIVIRVPRIGQIGGHRQYAQGNSVSELHMA